MPPRTFDARRNSPSNRDITFQEVLARVPAYTPPARSFKTDVSLLPVYDQKSKGACVEFADGKYGGAYLNYKRTGHVIEPSARFGYAVAHVYGDLDYTVQGTMPRDYATLMVKAGLPTTSVVPDQLDLPLKEFTTLDVTVAMVNNGMQSRVQGFATANVEWEEIKLAINLYGFVTLTAAVGDWSTGKVQPPTNGNFRGYHRVFIYGYDEPVDGKRILLGRNSWGTLWGYNGDFEMSFNDYQNNIFDVLVYPPEMPQDLIAAARGKTIKPAHKWIKAMTIGMTDPDVKAYQEVLRYEGLIASSQPATGYYGEITRKATPEFQERYGVSSLAIILSLGGRRAGAATIAALNRNFAPIYPVYPEKIVAWAKAAKNKEGYFAPGENALYPNGSLSWRYKNPGNIKDAPVYRALPGFVGVSPEGFCIFIDIDAGMNALCHLLNRACTGQSATYPASYTLYQFYAKYAPKSDGNDPVRYAEDIAREIGVDPNTPISSFIN